jgi:hypothetical protein
VDTYLNDRLAGYFTVQVYGEAYGFINYATFLDVNHHLDPVNLKLEHAMLSVVEKRMREGMSLEEFRKMHSE